MKYAAVFITVIIFIFWFQKSLIAHVMNNFILFLPDMVYNFDKYTYDDVDNRRVSYDFDSVMHYGETAFR